MKRSMPWSDEEDDSSSEKSSLSHSDKDAADDGYDKTNGSFRSKAGQSSKGKDTEVKSGKKKSTAVDFDALRRHGYKGGPSVLRVPPPKEDEKTDWSWSTGRETRGNTEIDESYEERQKTRAALNCGEELPTAQTRKDKKNVSFSQKEKRKRELGQASRGKNYVEEEKRTLRDSGIYSGFDT